MSERLHEYFAGEASEYLDQLETLLSRPGPPDLDELLRLTRGVRGSAQMAGADTLVEVAERLEDGVRAVQAKHIAWSDDFRQLSARTVADLKVLVRATSRWGQVEQARVRDAIERWSEVDTTRERPRHHGALSPEVDIASLFFDDDGPHELSSGTGAAPSDIRPPAPSPSVPIESLQLSPEDALREALAMRGEVERALRGGASSHAGLSVALRELFDLIEMAAGGSSFRE